MAVSLLSFIIFFPQDHPDEVAEAKAQGTISIKTYIKFFFAGTKVAVLFLLLLLFFLSEVRTYIE